MNRPLALSLLLVIAAAGCGQKSSGSSGGGVSPQDREVRKAPVGTAPDDPDLKRTEPGEGS